MLCDSRQMVDLASHVVVYPEAGHVTTQDAGVAIKTINHPSHRER